MSDLVLFFKQLSTLISANIPLLQSCKLLLSSQKKSRLHPVTLALIKKIEGGQGLSQGLREFPQIFSELITELIYIGEYSGTLEIILNQVTLLLEKSAAIRNQIKQALFYPAIVLIFSILVCLSMLIFIVPRFAEFFDHIHGQIPPFTLFIIHLSKTFREKYTLIIFLLAGFCWVLKINKHALIHLPMIRYFSHKFFILQFSRNLSILYTAGINISDGLQMIARTYAFPEFRALVLEINSKVLTGQQLHMAMESCAIFTPAEIQLIKIGEESGKLQKMLDTLTEINEAEIERWIKRMNQLLEPLIMVILGVLIGGLLVAMYLPIFNLGMTLNGYN